MIPNPIFTATRAVTIDAPPEVVWPWIAHANMPTPWVGVWERFNTNVFMLWVVVLATVLQRIGPSRDPGLPSINRG